MSRLAAVRQTTPETDVAPPEQEALRAAAAYRSGRVQTLRGLACLLLVAFHVIGSHSTSGLHAGDGSAYRQFANLFTHLRMPLFTFLSGFVYAYRPVARGQHRDFARKKIKRLLLPLLCVSTLYFLGTMLLPDATGRMPLAEAWRIYLFPYVHFWFLQAVIVVFAGVVLLERLGALSTARRFLTVLAVFIVLHLCVRMEEAERVPLSMMHAAYLAPFFLLGLGANRFRQMFEQRAVLWASLVLFILAMGIHCAGVWWHLPVTGQGSLIGLVIGASGALVLLRLFPRLRLLEILGAYSFTVYLFHPFFVAASRTALKMISSPSSEVLFGVGLGAGVLGPPVLERLLRRMPTASLWLFGQSKPARQQA